MWLYQGEWHQKRHDPFRERAEQKACETERRKKIAIRKQEVDSKVDQTSTATADEGVKELLERDARQANAGLFGVKEGKSEDASERKAEDVKMLQEICEGLQVHVDVKQIKVGKRAQISQCW